MLFLCLKGGDKMAENTSVGSIQLDVEINQNSLNIELDKLSKVVNNSFKNMFNGFIGQTNNFVKKSISGMFSGIEKVGQASADSSSKASKSINKLNNEYEKTQQKINEIRSELAKLFAEQDAIIMAYKDMPTLSGMTKEESLEHLLKSDARFNELSTQIDKLTSQLDPLVIKNKKLAAEINKVGNQAINTGHKMNNMGNSIKRVVKNVLGLTWFKRMFTRETKKASKAATGFGNTIRRVTRMLARRLIVYQLLARGIMAMTRYMWSAFKTNEQFAHSLNVIKTNLRVAFQPIYDYILPAINVLMRAIATATTYIASAISALFGKTYKQSFNSAKAMNKQIEAMEGLGKAAGGAGKKAKKAGKDAKGALMAFDEINQLDIKDDRDDSGGAGGGAGGFEMEMPDLSTIDMSGIERFKEVMSKIFEPFKSAWEKEGQNTINSIKYALGQIKESVKAIGNSWLEVWTNGTGQKTVENILVIIQNLFNIVGNLAGAFRKAWEENNVGTRIIQNIADIFNIVLETIKNITGATAEWAKGLDFTPLLESVNKLLEALKPFTENIGQGLAWLWENVLLPLASWTIEDVLPRFLNVLAEAIGVLNSVIEVLKPYGIWLWEKFLLPLAKWTGGAIVDILDGIAYALGAIADYIDGIQDVIASSDSFLDALVNVGKYLVEGLFKGIISALAGISSWLWDNLVRPIINGVKNLFGIQSPSTVFIEIGEQLIEGLFVGISNTWNKIVDFFIEKLDVLKNLFTETWESIKETATEIWNNLKESVTEIWTSISEFISNTWNIIREKTSETWNNIKSFLIDKIWNPIKTVAKTIWEGIKKAILDPINQAWTKLKEIWTNIKTFILGKWNEIRQGIANMKDKLVNAIKEPFNIAKDWIGNIIKDAYNWGRNLISNFVDGIKSMVGKVKDAVSGVVSGVKDFLGFSSPTKKGPGKDADKWMPNLMQMLADGIEDNLYEVSAAVNLTAGTIKQGIQPNTDDMASAVGSAVLQSMQMVGSNQNQGDTIVEFNIDGATFARLIIPYIDKEKGRTGETIIQPI